MKNPDVKEKFTGKSEIYAKYRPSYSLHYLEYLKNCCALTPDSSVADIGSGTGIFSGQLLALGVKVYAIEPNLDMRAKAENTFASERNFISCNGSAENTGLPENSMDILVAAQSFHWFDRMKFASECKRILKAGAPVALVWDCRDMKDSLIIENDAVCREHIPNFKGFQGGVSVAPEGISHFFKCFEHRVFPNDRVYDLDGFIGRNLSSSHAPRSSDANYSGFVTALEILFNKFAFNGTVVMKFFTESYFGYL